MAYSRYIDENGIVVTSVSGKTSLNEIIEIQNELINYADNGEIYELVIHAEDLETVLDSEESRESSMHAKEILKGIKKGAIAFVAGRDLVFGILRQLQLRVGNEFLQMAVFRNEETALKWLLELKSSSKSAPKYSK